MIELRYVVQRRTTTEKPILQFRYMDCTGPLNFLAQWSEWKCIPTVVVTDEEWAELTT